MGVGSELVKYLSMVSEISPLFPIVETLSLSFSSACISIRDKASALVFCFPFLYNDVIIEFF
jgi:hypothetical protein